jgi:hypothetical protein
MPKLAICRADAEKCFLEYNTTGAVRMTCRQWVNNDMHQRLYLDWPAGSSPACTQYARREAIVPLIPIEHRPKRGLANYHVLWEAEWRKVPPVDPVLLRRIGAADLWVVCAAWDLTPVEQAALAARM